MSISVLDRLKEARAASQSGASSSPFFFVKTNETALIRLLRNHDQMVVIRGHRKFNEATRKYEHNVCAKEFDLECQLCLDSAGDWKLKAQDFFYQVVYCHKKVSEDGQQREVAQLLYLEMPAYDGVLAGLDALYWADDDGSDLTKSDYKISKVGEGNKSKYSVVERKNAPMELPADLILPTDEKIRSDVEQARPCKTVDGSGIALGELNITKADTTFMPDEFGD